MHEFKIIVSDGLGGTCSGLSPLLISYDDDAVQDIEITNGTPSSGNTTILQTLFVTIY